MSCKHALLRHNIFTLLHQTLSKKSFEKTNYPKIPQKQTKSPPLETSKPKNMLKNDAREELKNRNVQKKNKRALGSGRYYSQNQE